jgi:hypothetical protein
MVGSYDYRLLNLTAREPMVILLGGRGD